MDIANIRKTLITERRRRRLSLRTVGRITGVNWNTLGYFERGSMPDMDNLVKIANWLDIKMSDQAIVVYPESTLLSIRDVINRDPKLTAYGKGALAELMSVAYRLYRNR